MLRFHGEAGKQPAMTRVLPSIAQFGNVSPAKPLSSQADGHSSLSAQPPSLSSPTSLVLQCYVIVATQSGWCR